VFDATLILLLRLRIMCVCVFVFGLTPCCHVFCFEKKNMNNKLFFVFVEE
jgi:hypothetical protein